VAFVSGICCLGNMVSSGKYSVYLSTLDTPTLQYKLYWSVFFLCIPRRGTMKVNTANTHDREATGEES